MMVPRSYKFALPPIFLLALLIYPGLAWSWIEGDFVKVWEEDDKKEDAGQTSVTSKYSAGTYTDPVTGMEFVFIKGGCFMMGQTEEESDDLLKDRGRDLYDKFYLDELPQHRVCVDGFYIGKYEVTNKEYKLFDRNKSYKFTFRSIKGDRYPVVAVNWEKATAYAKWLSKKSY